MSRSENNRGREEENQCLFHKLRNDCNCLEKGFQTGLNYKGRPGAPDFARR